MKKKMKKTVCPYLARAVQEALASEPPPDLVMPPGWIEKVMAEIRKIGPLTKTSGSVRLSNDKESCEKA